MKILALLSLMCMALWAGSNYQVCGIITATGAVICGGPKDRQGAELASLAYNALTRGQFITWVQRIPKGKHKVKPQQDVQPQPPAGEDNSVPTNPTSTRGVAGISTH